jgi:cytochrome c-type biogenesis protein CcmE
MRKLVAVGLVLAAGVAYFVFSSTQSSAEYYQTIPEMQAHPQDRDVRVVGVVQNDVAKSQGGTQVQFTMGQGSRSLPVAYSGTLPDIFKPGVQVVVEGRKDSTGVFRARELQAKCPSKFTSSPAPAQGASSSR